MAIIASIGPAAPSGRPFWQARMSSSLAIKRSMSVTSQTSGQIAPVRKTVIAARTMTLTLPKTTAAVRCRKVPAEERPDLLRFMIGRLRQPAQQMPSGKRSGGPLLHTGRPFTKPTYRSEAALLFSRVSPLVNSRFALWLSVDNQGCAAEVVGCSRY